MFVVFFEKGFLILDHRYLNEEFVFYKLKLINASCLFLVLLIGVEVKSEDKPMVTIAILAKDKAHTLPLFLKCVESQTMQNMELLFKLSCSC